MATKKCIDLLSLLTCRMLQTMAEWMAEIDPDTADEYTSLEEFMKMRAGDYATYAMFCREFLSCVVGKLRFRKNTRLVSMDEAATVNDEAFALLLLENSYDRWVDVWTNRQNTNNWLGKHKRWESEVKPRYTNGGLIFTEGKRKYKGWSEEGIDRYNALVKLVKRDRAKHPYFADKFLEEEKASYEQMSGKKAAESTKSTKRPPTRAQHELWEADEKEGSSDGDDSNGGTSSTEEELVDAQAT